METNPYTVEDIGENMQELFSVFFTNHYWFAIYRTAKDQHRDGKYRTLMDAYRDAVSHYQRALSGAATRSNDHARVMLNELHKYCSKYMNVKCSFMDFVDVIVARLLPPESYQSIRHKHEAKIMTFRTVLLKVIGKFTNYILSRRLNDVLNDDESVRLRPDMLPACKQEFNVILEAERNELGAKINAVQHGVPAGGREDHIYRDINERLQHQIKILLHEKAELAQRCNQLSQAYLAIKDIALGKEQELAGQAKLIEELQANGRLVKQMVKNQQEQKPPAYVMMAPQMMAPQILPQQALAPPATPTISKPNVVLGTAPPVAKQVQPAEESGEESGAESGQESGEASGEDDLQALVMAPDE